MEKLRVQCRRDELSADASAKKDGKMVVDRRSGTAALHEKLAHHTLKQRSTPTKAAVPA